MAIQFSAAGDTLVRTTGSFLTPTSSIEVMIWLNVPNTPTTQDVWSLLVGTDLTQPYLTLGFTGGQLRIAGKNNSTSQASTAVTLAAGWHGLGVIYNASTHLCSLYDSAAVLLGSFTLDLSALTFTREQLGSIGTNPGGHAVSYFRSFQGSFLTDTAKMQRELRDGRHVLGVGFGLFCDTPISSLTDLSDYSGQNRGWTVTGVPTSVAGPIANGSPAEAVTISALPYTVTRNVVAESVAHTVYYQYTPAADRVLGARVTRNSGAFYTPMYQVCDALGAELAASQGFGVSSMVPGLFPAAGGVAQYLRISQNTSGGFTINPDPAVFDLSLAAGTVMPATPPSGLIYISDDTSDNWPIAAINPTTPNTVVGFTWPFAAGESSIALDTGAAVIAVSTAVSPSEVRVYNRFLAAPVVVLTDPDDGTVVTRSNGWFYACSAYAAQCPAYRISADGRIIQTWLTGATEVPDAIAVSPDGTILYHKTHGNEPIRRYNLATVAPMSDLVAAVPAYELSDREILCLKDGTIIAVYSKQNAPSDYDVLIRRYNPDGSLASSYNYPSAVAVTSGLLRPFYALDDPNSFWIWLPNPPFESGKTRFINIRVSDGAELHNTEYDVFENGGSTVPETTTMQAFGPSISCAAWVLPALVLASGRGSLVCDLRGVGAA